MSSGPEHYRAAEQLLGEARHSGLADVTTRLAAAQVHASLALAAATADSAVTRYCGDEGHTDRAWAQAVS